MSSFTDILQRLVERVPGAKAAIFADWEGEPVGEFALEMSQLDIQIVGAQWGIVWTEVKRSLKRAQLGDVLEMIVDGERSSTLVRKVTDQYYIVLVVGRDGHLAKALAELSRGADELRAEM